MRFENTKVFNFDGAFRGMRNPLNSWHKSDSDFQDGKCYCPEKSCQECEHYNDATSNCTPLIGEKDMTLAKRLIKGGSEHRKFLRQIMVSVDITAPLYWWKEFDTYKVGVTANSTSTMHKVASNPITIDCFEIDDYNPDLKLETDHIISSKVNEFIDVLEQLRVKYVRSNDKKYWKELIRWIPESWLQTRTVTLNYENVLTICRQRKTHKLNEWSGTDNKNHTNFIAWAKSLPYAEDLIFTNEEEDHE